MPGRNTCANLAVSLRNRSCTTTSSSRRSAAVTCWVFGSDWAMSSPCTNSARNVPSTAASNMFGMRSPGSACSVRAPQRLEHRAGGVVGHVPVAGQLVRERAHVARALHVVLAAQRVDADAVAADVAGGHREVGHAHHHRRALAVLGDAEPVVDGGVAAGAYRRAAARTLGGRHAGEHLGGLGAVLRSRRRTPPTCAKSSSQRSATNSWSTRPSVTTTWARALTIATFVPGRSCR